MRVRFYHPILVSDNSFTCYVTFFNNAVESKTNLCKANDFMWDIHAKIPALSR